LGQYVTAVCKSDAVDGWRHGRHNSGVVIPPSAEKHNGYRSAGSHAIHVSKPEAGAKIIERAAKANGKQ
jgi:hypothetical protein